jgi:hypothetical protein
LKPLCVAQALVSMGPVLVVFYFLNRTAHHLLEDLFLSTSTERWIASSLLGVEILLLVIVLMSTVALSVRTLTHTNDLSAWRAFGSLPHALQRAFQCFIFTLQAAKIELIPALGLGLLACYIVPQHLHGLPLYIFEIASIVVIAVLLVRSAPFLAAPLLAVSGNMDAIEAVRYARATLGKISLAIFICLFAPFMILMIALNTFPLALQSEWQHALRSLTLPWKILAPLAILAWYFLAVACFKIQKEIGRLLQEIDNS